MVSKIIFFPFTAVNGKIILTISGKKFTRIRLMFTNSLRYSLSKKLKPSYMCRESRLSQFQGFIYLIDKIL